MVVLKPGVVLYFAIYLIGRCLLYNPIDSGNNILGVQAIQPTIRYDDFSMITQNFTKIPIPVVIPDDDTEQVFSVTVRISSSIPGSTIFYTLDGSIPSHSSLSTTSNKAILLDNIGSTTLKCIVTKDGMIDSDIVNKVYKIIDRSEPPVISPNGGTYAGSVVIILSSSTSGSSICYNINSKTVPNKNDLCVLNGSKITLSDIGRFILKAITISSGMEDSPITTSIVFNILAKVATPVISPSFDTFPTSAMLTFKCSTLGSVIYYSIDEGIPTQSSLVVGNGESIVIDTVGQHVIQAFATESNMLASEVVIKTINILERLQIPEMIPPPGKYIGNQKIKFHCISGDDDVDVNSMSNAIIYYTADGISTPNPSDKNTLHVQCDESAILLQAPGTYTLRTIVTKSGKSPSAVAQGMYILSRPRYDQYPVNPLIANDFKVQPDVEIIVVEKDLVYSNYCPKRNIRGRLVVLHNPIGHFDILPPIEGCSSGKLELPSISGRSFRPVPGFNLSEYLVSIDYSNIHTTKIIGTGEYIRYDDTDDRELVIDISKANKVPSYINKLLSKGYADKENRNNYKSLKLSLLNELGDQYDKTKDLGCQVVTNAGFFNTTSNKCFGNIISYGIIHQLSHSHNVNFGIRNGSFVVGYLDHSEILDPSLASFEFLVSGVGWLVRDGKSYVSESFSTNEGDAEDMSAQSTGKQFLTIKSARTAIGYDIDGNLLLLQVEGETWVRGMSLYEFTDLAIELGFVSAINLDGGGSATMTQNHSLISEPSWKCIDPPYNKSSLFHCEKKVSSITCIHAMAPPFIEEKLLYNPNNISPTLQPSKKLEPDSTILPTFVSSSSETLHKTDADDVDSSNNPVDSNFNATQMTIEIDELKRNLYSYQIIVFVLLITLSVILITQFIVCVYFRYCRSSRTQSNIENNAEYIETYNGIPDDTNNNDNNSLNNINESYLKQETEMVSRPPTKKSFISSHTNSSKDYYSPTAAVAAAIANVTTIVDWKPSSNTRTEEEDDFYNDSDDNVDDDIEQSRPLTASKKTTDHRNKPASNHVVEYISSEDDDDDDNVRKGTDDAATVIRPLLSTTKSSNNNNNNNNRHSKSSYKNDSNKIIEPQSSPVNFTKLKKTTKKNAH